MIIFLYGGDTFRSRRKLREVKDKFLREVDSAGNSLVVVDGETATIKKINEVIGSSSLFARKRMVVIERLFANKNKVVLGHICRYLQNMAKRMRKKDNLPARSEKDIGDNIIVFWDDITGEKTGNSKLFKFLTGGKYAQNFRPLSNTEAVRWVKKEVEKRGMNIRNKAAYVLVGLSGCDLWRLSNEIDKLIGYKVGGYVGNPVSGSQPPAIEKDDVERMVRGNFDENIFSLTDAIGNKNKDVALRLFEEEMEAGVAETYLLHMIVRQFRILLQVRQAVDNGYGVRKITSRLKLHPFVVQKGLSQARKFSFNDLKKIFSRLAHLDYEIKSGRLDIKTAFDLLILKI